MAFRAEEWSIDYDLKTITNIDSDTGTAPLCLLPGGQYCPAFRLSFLAGNLAGRSQETDVEV